MFIPLLQVVFSFMVLMMAGPSLLVAWIVLYKGDIGTLMVQHGALFSAAFGLYGLVMAYAFFALQDHFIAFKPQPDTFPSSQTELMDAIESAFSRPVEGQTLFEVARVGEKLIVTWSASLDYFQITHAGGERMKRVIVLTFDEPRHRALFIMKDRTASWRASTQGAEYSLNFATGLSAEFTHSLYPSLTYSRGGGLSVELKQLRYDSNELWQPIHDAVLSHGWSLHGGMVPGTGHRLLISVLVGLFFGLIGHFAVFLNNLPDSTGAVTTSQTSAPADLETQVVPLLADLPTEKLAQDMQAIMSMPPQQLSDYHRQLFPHLLHTYMQRPYPRPEVVEAARAYAATLTPAE